MKKRIFSLAVLFFILLCTGSAHFKQTSLGMNITAFNGRYHNIIVNPIYGSLSDPIGMPFDLTAEDVKYNAAVFSDAGNAEHTFGRQIAEWSVHSNFKPIDIIIDADNLVKVDSSGNPIASGTEFSYYLFLPYIYYDGVVKDDVSGFMIVESGITYSSLDEGNAISKNVDPNGVNAGINTGFYPIRFMLTSESSNRIHSSFDESLIGTYTANVTITVEGN